MNKRIIAFFTIVSIFILSAVTVNARTPKILVFAKTAGFHHNSIAAGLPAIIKLGQENNFLVDTTTDAAKFTEQNLKQYAAVVFLSTTGDVLNDEQQAAFEKFIQSGKGFAGVHAATDTEYGWPWYNKLVGAYFLGHPKQQDAVINVVDSSFIATKGLPKTWKRFDEWYNFKDFHWDDVHVLLNIDETSYTGGANGNYHPMSWYHNYDGGRAFYTELGHTDESYADPLYLGHLLGGIKYAIGK